MRQKRTLATAVLLVTALAGSGCAAAINPLNIEAARTEARVKTALVNDAEIGTRVISVRMLGSVAQLTGRVRTPEEEARAIAVAGAVSGVSRVESRLQIGADPPAGPVEAGPAPDPMRGPAYELAELADSPEILAVGAAASWANQHDRSTGSRFRVNPLFKLGSGAGLGPAVAFEWFDAAVTTTPDARSDSGAAKIRPVMAGVRYTMPIGRVVVSPSLVGGYAFNSLKVPDEGEAPSLPVDIGNSFVWRPGVSLWMTSSRRTTVNLSVGRAFTSPKVTIVEDGRLIKRTVSADTTVVLVGLVYRIF